MEETGNMYTVDRDVITGTLREALEPLEYVYAMWEGGSTAMGRMDQWSDIDLAVDVEDDKVEEVFQVAEAALASLSPIELKYRVPEPTWHGHSQTFYRLSDAGPFLIVDLGVVKHSSADKLLQAAIHGRQLVYFDKANVVQSGPLDKEALLATISKRLAALPVIFDMFQSFALKEVYRRDNITALSYYQGFTLRPLVEALRIKHDPVRYNFHARYLYHILPTETVQKLERLFFVSDAEDLLAKREEGEEMFRQVMASISLDEVRRVLDEQAAEN
jgi:hypothetical protein